MNLIMFMILGPYIDTNHSVYREHHITIQSKIIIILFQYVLLFIRLIFIKQFYIYIYIVCVEKPIYKIFNFIYCNIIINFGF